MNMALVSLILLILSAVLAVAATVLAFIFLLPQRRQLPRFFHFLRELCSFKYLIIEKGLQALYICSTVFTVLYGLFGTITFGYETNASSNIVNSILGSLGSSGSSAPKTTWVWEGWKGLIIMIVGPIVIRLVYEWLMLFVLQVKNTIAINSKMTAADGSTPSDISFERPNLPPKAARQNPPMNNYQGNFQNPPMNNYSGNYQNPPRQ